MSLSHFYHGVVYPVSFSFFLYWAVCVNKISGKTEIAVLGKKGGKNFPFMCYLSLSSY